MKVCVTIAVFNEADKIGNLILALIEQSRSPDSVIIVDDGSTDNTREEVLKHTKNSSLFHYIFQKNAGPAKARNVAWKNADADICVFTDGDCVPDKYWLERLLPPFDESEIGATCGTYYTVNTDSWLARYIGLEIAYRYKDVCGQVDAHGSYNLAVRKQVLKELGGFNEDYPLPSGEDWDLTYRISERYKIIFVPDSLVGHYHPEKFWWYMKNQERRGFDRVKLYFDHPYKVRGDSYTQWYVKYQVILSGAFVICLPLFFPFVELSFLIPASIGAVLLGIAAIPFRYYFVKEKLIAFLGVNVSFVRGFFWFKGLFKGLVAKLFEIKNNEK